MLKQIGKLMGGKTATKAWSPSIFLTTELRGWWHADDHGTALMTDDGAGLISAWVDRNNAISLTAAGSARPTWSEDTFNGRACVVGDGTANLTTTTLTNVPTGSTAGEIWVSSVTPSGASAIGTLVAYGGTGAGTNRQIRKTASYKTQATDGTTNASDTRVSLIDEVAIANCQFSGTSLRLWVNDFEISAGTVTITSVDTGTTRLRFFANTAITAANILTGSIRQILIFARALTDDERHRLYVYLANDAGTTDAINPDNPYIVPQGDAVADFSALPSFFTPADATETLGNDLRVYMPTSTPPTSDAADETTYAYWPNTDVGSQSTNLIASSTWSGRKWGFLWANRRNTTAPNIKSNPIFPAIRNATPQECRVEYSTVAKANAATKVRAMHWCGYTSGEYEAVASAAGFTPATDIISRATLAADPATYFTGLSAYNDGVYAIMTDKIWLNDTAPAGMYGIALDYECQDSRTTAETLAFVEDIAAVIQAKGFKVFLYTNRLDGSSAPSNGIDITNGADLLAAVDHMSFLFVAGSDIDGTFDAQKAIVGL